MLLPPYKKVLPDGLVPLMKYITAAYHPWAVGLLSALKARKAWRNRGWKKELFGNSSTDAK